MQEKNLLQWSTHKVNMITNNTLRPGTETTDTFGDEYTEYLPEGYTDGFFSPDIVFAEFLETLEGEAGYSLKWDFDIDARYTHPVTAEQYEKLKVYDWLRSYGKHFTPDGEPTDCYMFMWGDDTLADLPELSQIYIDNEKSPWGVTWINEPKGYKKAWENLVKQACRIVDIYNSPELREQYGIVDHETEKTGDWEGLDQNSEPLEDLLEAEKLRDKLIAEVDDYTAVGFKVHKDWIECWLAAKTVKLHWREIYTWVQPCQ
jgi:hypothetical protein